ADEAGRRDRADRAGKRAGVAVTPHRTAFNGARVMRMDRALSESQIRTLAADLMATDASIESIEPDVRLQPQFVPNDTYFPNQWHYYEAVAGINLPAAWDRATGAGIKVAVIDTGYRPHVDLAANILPGYDFILDVTTANDGTARDADPSDPGDWSVAGACGTGSAASNSSWHGTHVAGTIAAVTNSGSGVAGVAFGAKVVPVRVLGRCGGYTSDIADAIVWASGGSVTGVPANANVARVINMSLGGQSACGTTLQSAINSARARSTVVVVAAGNSNASASAFSPANCAGVIAVGAVTRTGAKASFSNYGTTVDISAPGADGILSTLNAGTTTPGADNYVYYQGTSMATPHVAGVAALMLSKNAALTPDQVEAMIKSSAKPFPVVFTGGGGAGILDAKKAVDTAMASLPTAVAEVEPNDTFAAPQILAPAHAVVSGTMASAADNDYYGVSVAAGKTLSATLNMTVSTQNYQLYLYNPSGALVASSANAAGLPETVKVANTTTAAQLYRVRVAYAAGGTGATAGKYVLNLLQQ
ncbi:S8 family peptidase, partial [Sphaerotilus sp.]|uniref:S8 family peptidase n=1 Tax=Sphaerotilus sp. TaxID=2093942 RepID=UPI0034E264C0